MRITSNNSKYWSPKIVKHYRAWESIENRLKHKFMICINYVPGTESLFWFHILIVVNYFILISMELIKFIDSIKERIKCTDNPKWISFASMTPPRMMKTDQWNFVAPLSIFVVLYVLLIRELTYGIHSVVCSELFTASYLGSGPHFNKVLLRLNETRCSIWSLSVH